MCIFSFLLVGYGNVSVFGSTISYSRNTSSFVSTIPRPKVGTKYIGKWFSVIFSKGTMLILYSASSFLFTGIGHKDDRMSPYEW